MKKLIALLLAAALALGTAGMAFAEVPPAEPMDSGAAEQAFEFEYSFIPAELERELRAESGWDEEGGVDAPASYAASGNYFGNRLTGNAKIFYDQWVSYFEEIAETGTGISKVTVTGLNLKSDAELSTAIRAAFHAILKDHTELLYWLNKTISTSSSGTEKEITSVFPVITMYRGAEAGTDSTLKKPYYVVKANNNDKEKAESVAAEIVTEANKLATDYEKVKYFNQQICEFTEYDDAAVDGGLPNYDPSYDDTFQWVDVFNKRPVVCEGYAKAFKYLCDEADIGCLLVEGTLGPEGQGAGNHMWNLVELGNKWYVVDCTNNDVAVGGKAYQDWLTAVGYNNARYKAYGFDPVRYSDGKAVPLNPDNVLLSANDYTPGVVAEEHSITVSGGTASLQKAKVGTTVTVTANAAPSGKVFNGWTASPSVTFVSASSTTTTFAMPDSNVTVTANYRSTGGSGGGSSGGGGGGGNSSGSSEPSSPSQPIYTYDITAIASKTQTAVADAIAKALAAKQGAATANIVLQNAKSMTPELMKSVLDAARTASAGKGVAVKPILVCDTVVDGKVVSRLSIDPAKSTLKTELQVGASMGNQSVEDKFAKFYANSVKVVKFEQSGSFGMAVNAAVKVDLTGLNTKTLRFYNYSVATNSFTAMPYPAYSIDANGYLHFSTTLGNNVIITDKPLAVK